MTDIVERLRDWPRMTPVACKEAADEIERLRELFGIDGEQHAIHVREIEARHEIRHQHYCAEIERLRAEVAQQRKQWEDVWRRNVDLLAEIERLRQENEQLKVSLVRICGMAHNGG